MHLHRIAAAAILACLAAASQAQPRTLPAAAPSWPMAQSTTPEPAGQPPQPSAATAEKVEKVPDDPSADEQRDAQLMYEVLVGEISAEGGDAASAYQLLLDAARRSGDDRLFRRAAEVALQARAGDSALIAARAWKDAKPASREANSMVLQILVALNRVEESSLPLAREMALTEPAERIRALNAVPQLYARVTDKKAAQAVVERALAQDLEKPNSPAEGTAAWTTVGRMRLAAGDISGTLEAARRAQALDAQSDGAAILALELMAGKTPEAEDVVKRYLVAGKPPAPEIRLAYARTLVDAQRSTDAKREIQTVTTESPQYAEGWLVRGSQEAQDGQLADAEKSVGTFLELLPASVGASSSPAASPAAAALARSRDQAYLIMAQAAEKRGDAAAANAWLDRISSPQAVASVQLRRASLLASQGKLDEARALLRALPERTPADAKLKLQAEVQLLRDNNRPEDAYQLLAQAHRQNPDDVELTYDLAMNAEKLGRPEEMEKLLREVIAKKPDFHHAYNALGYSLADRGVRLPEARELIMKALSFTPDDPFIRDSLGWVEYRMGHIDEALRILEAAYKTRPDPEIAAHLGEVLWKAGKRDRATEVLKEGLSLNSGNDTLQQVIKRLQVRL
ncbi:tetratricopeptide repeat protein [Xylophilus sp. GOD-11R]|uniref:tetratricopeptide repeat protein n=1 Tax=Xylophilus sp. GOD-11R TaxID=3089814 RepID=UPI00298C8171|nr:tetratricopeptide repeat protein [Xylophilus sp. GOD-11R]WPB56565.1 tetratricopeptide repeat protein [Xylophilus sp. GOD-11R]